MIRRMLAVGPNNRVIGSVATAHDREDDCMVRIRVGVDGSTYEPWRDNFLPDKWLHALELGYLTNLSLTGTWNLVVTNTFESTTGTFDERAFSSVTLNAAELSEMPVARTGRISCCARHCPLALPNRGVVAG